MKESLDAFNYNSLFNQVNRIGDVTGQSRVTFHSEGYSSVECRIAHFIYSIFQIKPYLLIGIHVVL